MGVLISADDVEQARRRGWADVTVPEGARVSPLAAERARDLGIRLVRAGEERGGKAMCRPGDSCGCSGSQCPDIAAPAGGGAAAAAPAGRAPACGGADSRTVAEVRRVVTAVLLRMMPGEFSPRLVREVTERVVQAMAGRG